MKVRRPCWEAASLARLARHVCLGSFMIGFSSRTRALDGALQEAGGERPGEIGVIRLEARVVRVTEAVLRVREEVPLHELAVGDEALPERALDGGRGDEVLARADHAQR